MKERILSYRKHIDAILADTADTDWNALLTEHLTQVGFFQHERLIHLMVTLAFALFTLLSILTSILTDEPGPALLGLSFLVLLIPYIMHYYLLENEVQRMYGQYDEILKILKKAEKKD